MAKENIDEMGLLLSEKEIKVGTKRVVIKKISLLDSIRLASNLSLIVSKIVDRSEESASAMSKLTYTGDDAEEVTGMRMIGLMELLGVIGEGGTFIVQDLMVKSTNLTDDEIEAIDLEGGIDILLSIYDVNKDFFMKSIKKLAKKLPKSKRKKAESTKTQ